MTTATRERPGSVQGAVPGAAPVERRDRRRWWARHAYAMRGRLGYLDLLPHYGIFDLGVAKDLRACHSFWTWERKSDKRRLRGRGCGDRRYCPLCGTYRGEALGRDAFDVAVRTLVGAEVVKGVETDYYGLKAVLTLPKKVSERIDALVGRPAWSAAIDGLFAAARAWVEQTYGPGLGGVMGLDAQGESRPGVAHYHVNILISPLRRTVLSRAKSDVPRMKKRKADARRRGGGTWTEYNEVFEETVVGAYSVLPKQLEKAKLPEYRRAWAACVRKAKGLREHVQDGDGPDPDGLGEEFGFQAGWLGDRARLGHWLRYLTRPLLSDLWKGWRGPVDRSDYDAGVGYEYSKISKAKHVTRKQLVLSPDDVRACFKRSDLPTAYHRIRWYGWLSDSEKGAAMRDLGFESEEIEGDGDGDEWVKEGASMVLVAFDGTGAWFAPLDGGERVHVAHADLEYRPSGVKLGTRRRWYAPGEREGPSGS